MTKKKMQMIPGVVSTETSIPPDQSSKREIPVPREEKKEEEHLVVRQN